MFDNQGLLNVDGHRDELESWAQSRTLPAGDVFRARLILALADGMSYREIERKLGASAPTVSKWTSRFEKEGIEGLQGRHRGSKPRRATPALQARIIRRAQQKPADGSTHWSCRKLSDDLGVSKSTVQRVLAQAKLRPHWLDRYMASNDPEFETKAADIIGLYMNPRSTPPCSAWTRRRRFKRWTGWIRCCRCRRVEPNGTGSNIIGMARSNCMRR